MKNANKNSFRVATIADLFEYFSSKGEDCGMIASNSFNFPIVVNDEEGFAEVVVKVTNDEGDDGYMKREQYNDKVALAEERAKAKAEKAKAEKAKKEKRKEEKSE